MTKVITQACNGDKGRVSGPSEGRVCEADGSPGDADRRSEIPLGGAGG